MFEIAPFTSAVNGCDSVVSSDSVSVVSLLSSLYRELGTHFLRNVGRVGRPFRGFYTGDAVESVRLESSRLNSLSIFYNRTPFVDCGPIQKMLRDCQIRRAGPISAKKYVAVPLNRNTKFRFFYKSVYISRVLFVNKYTLIYWEKM